MPDADVPPGTTDSVDAQDPTEILRWARERVDALACPGGDYHVACARTGVRPEPVTGVQFRTESDAHEAARAAQCYREALCRLDPALPSYDLVVYESDPPPVQLTCARERVEGTRTNGLPRSRQAVTVAGERDEEWLRIENCPVVHITADSGPLDDEVVGRQIDSKLRRRDEIDQ